MSFTEKRLAVWIIIVTSVALSSSPLVVASEAKGTVRHADVLPARPCWRTGSDHSEPLRPARAGSGNPVYGEWLDRFFPVDVPAPATTAAQGAAWPVRWGVVRYISGFGGELIWVAFLQQGEKPPKAVAYVGGPLESAGRPTIPSTEANGEKVAELLHLRMVRSQEISPAALDRLLTLLERSYVPALGPPGGLYCCDQPSWTVNLNDDGVSLHASGSFPVDRWDDVREALEEVAGAVSWRRTRNPGAREPVVDHGTGTKRRLRRDGWRCGVPEWLKAGAWPMNINRRNPSTPLDAIAPMAIQFPFVDGGPLRWWMAVRWFDDDDKILFAVLGGDGSGAVRIAAIRTTGEDLANVVGTIDPAEYSRLPEFLRADTIMSDCLTEEEMQEVVRPILDVRLQFSLMMRSTGEFWTPAGKKADWGQVSIRLFGTDGDRVEYEGDLDSQPVARMLHRLDALLTRHNPPHLPGDGEDGQ